MKVLVNGVERDATSDEMADITRTQASLEATVEAPVILYPADLWRRADQPGEAEKIMEAMNAQPIRIQKIFDRADTYRSDDELWPLLDGAAKQLFGDERAAELLAPSN